MLASVGERSLEPGSLRPTKRVPETTKAQLLSEPGLLRVCWNDVSSSSDQLRGGDTRIGARGFQGVLVASGGVTHSGSHGSAPTGRHRRRALCLLTMMPLRARVKNGRLLLDEPTDLPDGTEVDLAVVDDDLDDDDRAALHAALEASEEDFSAGKGIPAAEVIAGLRRA